MEIEEFVQKLGFIYPSLEQYCTITKLKNPEIDINEIISFYSLSKPELLLPINPEDDFLTNIIKCTNIPISGIGIISFYNEFSYFNTLIEFARFNDLYSLCYDMDSKSIYIYNDDDLKVEVVTDKFDDFLLYLIEHEKYFCKIKFGIYYNENESKNIIFKLKERGFKDFLKGKFY